MTTDAPGVRPRGRYLLPITLLMAALHVGAFSALFFFSWPAFLTGVLLYWVVGGLGVGIGYHRLLTHRSFKVPKLVEYGLTLLGTLALQGGPVWWVVTHRLHHAGTDGEDDPHSPRNGRWWSHMGWILDGYTLRHDISNAGQYAPELARDRFHLWLTHYHLVPPAVLGVGLFAVGGLPFLLWGLFAGMTLLLHTTWMVNSVTHIWGPRRFATRDDSRNNWWVALLTFGEGWHNNHHAFPATARHGFRWYEVDVNWWCIRTMQMVGIATGVRLTGVDAKPTATQDAS